MVQDLTARTVVLIGGGTGIGFQVALRAAEAGASLVLGSRNLDKLSTAAAQLEHRFPGTAVRYSSVDVEDGASIEQFISRIETIDHLLVTAANYVTGSLEELTLEQAASPFVSKFWGQYNAVRHARPRLSADASIVLMSGAASARPAGAAPAYVACNSAIEGLGRGLAVELAPIRVNVVSPGTVEGHLWANRDQSVRDQAFDWFRDANLLHSLPQEQDVAEVVMMLFHEPCDDRGYHFSGFRLYLALTEALIVLSAPSLSNLGLGPLKAAQNFCLSLGAWCDAAPNRRSRRLPRRPKSTR